MESIYLIILQENLPIFSNSSNEYTLHALSILTAVGRPSWTYSMIFQSFIVLSAHSTLKNHQICQKFGKKCRKVFLHCTLLLVLREGPTYSANLSIRDHMLCLIKIGPQNMGPTYWESPEITSLVISNLLFHS